MCRRSYYHRFHTTIKDKPVRFRQRYYQGNQDTLEENLVLRKVGPWHLNKQRAVVDYLKWMDNAQINEHMNNTKNNFGIYKSPTKTPTTQINHFFCSIYSYLKLEVLTKSTKLKNHFQLKAALYAKAIQSAHRELKRLKLGVSCERWDG